MGAIDRIRAIFDSKFAERLAEDENVKRAPEGNRDRLRSVLDRGRMTREEQERLQRQRENQARHHREGTRAADIG